MAALGVPAATPAPGRDHGALRVLLSTDGVGGVWDYALELARGIAAAGHAVRLASVGLPAADRLASIPDAVDLVTVDLRLEWMAGADRDVDAAGEWLSEAARDWRADVVHLNQLAYAIHDFESPTLTVVHSDVRSWFSEVRGTEAPPEWDPYGRWVTAGLHASGVVVAPSEYQSLLTHRHYGRTVDRVIHNGLTPPAAPPPLEGSPLVVSAGRVWDAAKGMRVLDAAVGILGDDAPEVHLIGDVCGPQGESFVARHVSTHGRLPREQVDAWLRRASIYVGASLYEPFGLAPLEAAFHGTALVLSDIGSFRELWDGCAVFFRAGDADGLATALASLMADPARCDSLGRAARSRALARYTADDFVAGYLDLYAAMRLELAAKPSCV